MRATRTSIALLALAVLAAGCAGGGSGAPEARPSPSTPAPSPSEPPEEAAIYAAVIRRLVTRDHTFGSGASPFRRVFVVDGALDGAGDPMKDQFGPADEPFPPALKAAVADELADLPPLRFVRDADRVRTGEQDLGGVRGRGVVVSLGAIEHRRPDKVHVPSAMWCSGLCGQWVTYVVEERGGRWKVTGITGPIALS